MRICSGACGGGGNFGVVTSFEYRLHAMDPMILGGVIAWPLAQARDVMRFYAEFTAGAPDELNLDPNIVYGPGGQPLVMLEACWSADKAQGERVLKPLRSFGKPAFDQIAAMPYTTLQSGADERNAPGIRFYSKSGFFTEFKPDDIDVLVDTFAQSPPNSIALVMQQGGGAIGRKPVGSTAFPNRRANYWVMVAKAWKDRADDETNIANVRTAWKSIEPRTSGFYVNSMADDEYQRVAANYGSNYARLVKVKTKYDRGNLFRLNANVLPT